MTKTLPPLNPLRVFDCVGRTGSFTAAAAQLGVTQSAVSRQVAVLESYLGKPLFRREQGGAVLTPAGEAYWLEIAPAIDRIAAATEAQRAAKGSGVLHLRVYATFAVKWLLGRLPRLHARHPEIDLQLSTTVAPVDFLRDQVDLAVQFGTGDWPGLHSQRLLPDIIQPIASPKLVAAGGFGGLDGLRHHRLLHSHYRRHDWRDWLRSVGRPDLDHPGTEFPSSVLTLQAAAEGLGVAIGQISLLAEDIAEGRFVPLFGHALERPLAHYLVWPKAKSLSPMARALIAWFEDELSGKP